MNIPESARQWLTNGERGLSSESIFAHMTGLNVSGWNGSFTPLDPWDVGRCRELLDAVPEFKARFHEMANVSKQWALLVENWDEICRLMDTQHDERGWSQPAYDLMAKLQNHPRSSR